MAVKAIIGEPSRIDYATASRTWRTPIIYPPIIISTPHIV